MTSYTAQDTQPHKRLQFTARMTATGSAYNADDKNSSKYNKTARPKDKVLVLRLLISAKVQYN